MPFVGTDFFNSDTRIRTRNFAWVNSGGVGVEQYPGAFDDSWRFLEWASLQYIKIAAAEANAFLDIRREGSAAFNQFWGRRFALADVTTDTAVLQGNEIQSLTNAFFLTPANIMSNGILIPPRNIIVLFSSAIAVTFEGVIHEADTIADLAPVLG